MFAIQRNFSTRHSLSRVSVIAVICASLALGACTSGERRGALTGIGASAGAVIGARQGGVGGAIAGAIIGGAAGLIVASIIDEIESRQIASAQMQAARSGRIVSSSFKNNSGQKVRQTTKVARTYDCGGTRCRELSTSITRDGAETSGPTATAREVKSGGKSEWVVE